MGTPEAEGDRLALVLSGGGARAAYQVGALAAIAERAPELDVSILTGVSAGAINTVYLAGHLGSFQRAVQDLRDEWLQLTPDRVYAVRPVRLGRALGKLLTRVLLRRKPGTPTVRGVMDVQPLRQFLAGCVHFEGIHEKIRSGRLHAVALSATGYSSGRTVTFVQGASDVPVWERHMRVAVRAELTLDHVMASVAIPIVFPAVKIGDEFFGDGSVRQTAPLAPAIHLGARRLLVVAMRAGAIGPREGSLDYPAAAEVMGLLLHSVFLNSLDADLERVERLNRLIQMFPPGQPIPGGLSVVDFVVLRPSRDLGAMALGYLRKLPFDVRMIVRAMGGERARASDFLSYLLFDPAYTGLVMELGYDDGRKRWGEIEPFLERGRVRVVGET